MQIPNCDRIGGRVFQITDKKKLNFSIDDCIDIDVKKGIERMIGPRFSNGWRRICSIHYPILLIFSLVASDAFATTEEEAARLYSEGMALIEENCAVCYSGTREGFLEGISLVEKAIEGGYADLLPAYKELAGAYNQFSNGYTQSHEERQEYLQKFLEIYEKVLNINRNDIDLSISYAHSFQGTSRRALEYRRILLIDPSHFDARLLLGAQLIDTRDPEKVEQGVSELLIAIGNIRDQRPTNDFIYIFDGMAQDLIVLGRSDLSERVSGALATWLLSTGKTIVERHCGACHDGTERSIGRSRAATAQGIIYLELAIEHGHPDRLLAFKELASAYGAYINDYTQSGGDGRNIYVQKFVELYEKILETVPNYIDTSLVYADTLANETSRALEYRRILEIDPSHFEARISWGKQLVDAGDPDEVEQGVRELKIAISNMRDQRPRADLLTLFQGIASDLRGFGRPDLSQEILNALDEEMERQDAERTNQ